MAIVPQAMVGHSLGEYVAACLADVFSLEDALAIIVTRGRLMEECPRGSMLAVAVPRDSLSLPESLSLAAVNVPEQCVVSGPEDAIARFEARLREQDTACQRLQTSHAFHSALMEPVLAPFREYLARITLRHHGFPISPTAPEPGSRRKRRPIVITGPSTCATQYVLGCGGRACAPAWADLDRGRTGFDSILARAEPDRRHDARQPVRGALVANAARRTACPARSFSCMRSVESG